MHPKVKLPDINPSEGFPEVVIRGKLFLSIGIDPDINSRD
jgi:hypothetical protein